MRRIALPVPLTPDASPADVVRAAAWVCFGAVAGLLLLVLGIRSYLSGPGRRLRTWLRLPITRLAAVQAGAVVRVRGCAQPGSAFPVEAPLSGRRALFYVVHAFLRGRTERIDRHGTELTLDDGSGAVARVRTDGAAVVLAADAWMENQHAALPVTIRVAGRLQPSQRAWAESRCGPLHDLYRVEEARVEPGQTITVVGRARRDPDVGLVLETRGADTVALLDAEDRVVRARAGKHSLGSLLVAAVGLAILLGSLGAAFWG